jgi:hypothetical protein
MRINAFQKRKIVPDIQGLSDTKPSEGSLNFLNFLSDFYREFCGCFYSICINNIAG